MAATTITAVSLPHTLAGYNLTDSAGFATLTTGAGNGVKFSFAANLIVVLKNDTGGAATFTVKVLTPTSYSTYTVTVTDPTIAVANGKTYLLRLDESPFRLSTGYITIECNVAGKVLVLDPDN